MIHPHLKTDEELLSWWEGDFHDKDQMQALEQLARRKKDNYSEQLKCALKDGDLDPDEIHWTYFEYIYDNDFVIEYVNNPKAYYNVDKAIFYIQWAIPNHFSLSEYLQLDDKSKNRLLQYYIEKLKDEETDICDFQSFARMNIYHDHIQSFDEKIEHIVNSDYIDYLKAANETSRIMTIECQLAKMKNQLHQSLVDWLYHYGQSGDYRSSQVECSTSILKSPARFLYDYSSSRLLEKLQGILKDADISLSEMPAVFLSMEIPPSYKLVEYHDEGDGKTLYDTEGLLGCYIPSKQEIHLFEHGIQWCAKRLSVDVDILREIVFIHELGHYMQHKMPCYKTKEWDYNLYIASYSPMDLHEGWAQLMDAWVVKDIKEYSNTFQSLVAVQSSPYQVYKNYEQDSYRRILMSLDDLRQLCYPATTKDWDTSL